MIYRNQSENKAIKWLAWSCAFSLFLHLSLLVGANYFSKSSSIEPEPRIIFPDVEIRVLQDIETFQETASERPDRADFMSTRNLNADEETSPDLETHNVIQQPSSLVVREPVESFSLSEADKLALNDPLLKSKVTTEALPASKGFEERLKRGRELKVNAFRHDASGYLTRIRRKLAVIWNPQSTLQADMYRYRNISTTIALVLTRKGELSDIRITEPSFFPQFDAEAVRTVRQSAPFANPPDYFFQDDNLAYLEWKFVLTYNNYGVADVE